MYAYKAPSCQFIKVTACPLQVLTWLVLPTSKLHTGAGSTPAYAGGLSKKLSCNSICTLYPHPICRYSISKSATRCLNMYICEICPCFAYIKCLPAEWLIGRWSCQGLAGCIQRVEMWFAWSSMSSCCSVSHSSCLW